MEPYCLILADDHAMFRQGLKKILQEHSALKIVGEATDGLELINLLKKVRTDAVILDISMPVIRGIEATREIKSVYPEIKILILTMHKRKEYLYHCLSAGAEGYLLKEDADTELYAAIKKVREGGVYISPILSEELTDDFVHMCRGDFKVPSDRLSLREREIVKLIAEGKKNKKIADILHISTRTVENHRANIMKKLKLKNTPDLVKYAIHKKYIEVYPWRGQGGNKQLNLDFFLKKKKSKM